MQQTTHAVSSESGVQLVSARSAPAALLQPHARAIHGGNDNGAEAAHQGTAAAPHPASGAHRSVQVRQQVVAHPAVLPVVTPPQIVGFPHVHLEPGAAPSCSAESGSTTESSWIGFQPMAQVTRGCGLCLALFTKDIARAPAMSKTAHKQTWLPKSMQRLRTASLAFHAPPMCAGNTRRRHLTSWTSPQG